MPYIAFLRACSEKGELFLVACALTGAIVGEMYGMDTKSSPHGKRWSARLFPALRDCRLLLSKGIANHRSESLVSVQILAASIVMAGSESFYPR